MNWKLIAGLSLFGMAMGVATVFLIPSTIEPFFWLVIFAICAYIIATRVSGQYFLALMGPVIGVVSGLVLGVFAVVAGKLVAGRRSPASTTRSTP